MNAEQGWIGREGGCEGRMDAERRRMLGEGRKLEAERDYLAMMIQSRGMHSEDAERGEWLLRNDVFLWLSRHSRMCFCSIIFEF